MQFTGRPAEDLLGGESELADEGGVDELVALVEAAQVEGDRQVVEDPLHAYLDGAVDPLARPALAPVTRSLDPHDTSVRSHGATAASSRVAGLMLGVALGARGSMVNNSASPRANLSANGVVST